MKAMILAAGFGTRLKPWTDRHPKALALVHGKTLLHRNIEYLASFGIQQVVINVHHFAEQIIQAINENNGWGSEVSISDETDAILETGGGLQRAAWFLQDSGHFVLMNADILTDLPLDKMISHHYEVNALATLATTDRKTSRYFLYNEAKRLCGWRNTDTGEQKITMPSKIIVQKAFSGIHVLSSSIFTLFNGFKEKFSIVDLYLSLSKEHIISSFDHSTGKLIDVGKPKNLELAETIFPA